MASLYDPISHIRRVHPQRWKEFDGPKFMKLQESEETWLKQFLAVQLSINAPVPVQRMFEDSRSAMVYSWFCYPLATLGMGHCFRTLELAVRLRVGGSKSKTFEKNVENLITGGVIPKSAVSRWDAARKLRNSACHPGGEDLSDPGQALNTLHVTKELIEMLYSCGNAN